ncbi:MAG: hypothetical protein J6L24_02980 [Oscillospiraceae bacterium]|nr:hypothetical protein [Oscillospiraceae bacterium]
MANYSPKEMAVFLRRCGDGVCDDSCPCADFDGDCGGALMRMGAEVLEEVAEDDHADS